MSYEFKYKPSGVTLVDFMSDESFFRGIRGPVGSGKSVASAIEMFRRSAEQACGPNGTRNTRWAVIRNTNPQLRTTTIKTWLDWFPEEIFGKFNWSPPYTHFVKVGDIDMEVIFLALDRPEDVKKLLSLELTGVWVNEAREISKSIIDGCTMRVGRYPSMKDGGPSWYGMICDTNAPDDDHWWSIMSGDAPIPDYITTEESLMLQTPDNWKFFTQPAGMEEEKDEDTGLITAYVDSKKAENTDNLTPNYYRNLIRGKTKSWIDVYVMNRLGALEDGNPVYPTFTLETHSSKDPLPILDDRPVYVGIDFGLTPAAVMGQKMPDGRWMLQRELVTQNMGTARFAELLRADILRHYPKQEVIVTGDPAGDFRAQTDETTPFQILRVHGISARPASTNDVLLRLGSVEGALGRMVDGKAGLLVDPSCKMLKKGFAGGYCYKRMQVSGEARYEDKPTKNKYSHIHDALQYMMLGAGEGRAQIGAGKFTQPAQAKTDFSVFDRQKRKKRQGWTNFKSLG